MYTHILVPTDGSELAQNGVDHALSLAKALGSRVTIINATRPFTPMVASEGWVPGQEELERFDEAQEKAALELLAAVRKSAEKMGLTVATEHQRAETAATAIVEAAERLGCNLIVMSSHGRRGVVRLLLGSQTSEVLARSTVPVLVVR